jgi:lipopolysaccharide/colanic/teichoic acid biosynthesis glycosyltransferase
MAKRGFDLLVSALLLLLAALPMLLIAAWVRWDSPGPALFRQTRVGPSAAVWGSPWAPTRASPALAVGCAA